MAAYNCGPGNVNKAIRRAGGGKKSFWDIYKYLPRETREYVPIYVAATYIMNFYERHNISPLDTALCLRTDTIMISKRLHLNQVAQAMNIPLYVLQNLNPHYKKNIIPAGKKHYPLRLPETKTVLFLQMRDSVYRTPSKNVRKKPVPAPSVIRIFYTVRTNDSYSSIAKRYGTTAKNILEWNKKNNEQLAVGERLIIYLPNQNLNKTALSNAYAKRK